MSVLRLPDGVFPTCVLGAGRGLMAVRLGDPRLPGWLVVYQWVGSAVADAVEIRNWGMQSGSPAFPALHLHDGLLWLAYHDGLVLHLRCLSNEAHQTFPALSNPVAFGGRWFAYCEHAAPYAVQRIDLTTGETVSPRTGAPTGLSRIAADGWPITVDEDRLVFHGATIPAFAPPLTVGEGPTGGVRWQWAPEGEHRATGTLWAPLDSFTPKCAVDGDLIAIASAGSGSVRLFCGTLAELKAESAIQPPAPPPIPEPKPPEPKPEPTMGQPLEPRVKRVIEQFIARFPVPTGAPGDAHEQRCREWMYQLAEQLEFSFPAEGYGVKRAGPGRPLSKDNLPRQTAAGLEGWDLMTGAGTGNPRVTLDGRSEPLDGQVFELVAPVNHLQVQPPAPRPDPEPLPDVPPVQPPPSDPPTDPPSSNVCAAILAELRKLNAHLGVR